ncbi:protein IWS1 homolog [Oppia nitens]|uniref:protein IWS1 homolog n=1 Tax=Oppia nitens TaxID=1686743 RepID=UPI0023DCA624|nr:protein IWS1 homolog [Oppia nitens]
MSAETIVRDIFGDSDDSEDEFEGFEGNKQSGDKQKDDSDNDNDEKDNDSDSDRPVKRRIISDDEDNDDNEDKNDRNDDNDDDDEDKEDRDDEHKDDEVKNDDNEGNDDSGRLDSQDVVPDVSSDEESDGERKPKQDEMVYDFDLMLQRKREESQRRRKRKNIDIINDNDDVIAELIQQMKQAADDDFELNKNRMTATRKLKMLSLVITQLRKLDLREAILDAGVLGVITDWLTRLPDGSLPHLQIRDNMLKILLEFNIDDVERIKASGIGKAVMYLFKHPKETKENKRLASQLIASWSRPIFNVDTDFHSMSKDEREKRDLEHMNKTKRIRSDSLSETDSPTITPKTKQPEEKSLIKPGEKGWVPRARVPLPSMKDYVVRPKSSNDVDMLRSGSSKRSMDSRIDKHMRNFRERQKQTKVQRAVPISIEGRKMAL